MEFDCQPAAAQEMLRKPLRRLFLRTFHVLAWKEQCEATRNPVFQIGTAEVVTAFLCAPAAGRNQLAKVAVALSIGCDQDQPGAITQGDLSPDEELEPGFLGCDMCPHDPCERTLVGQCQR